MGKTYKKGKIKNNTKTLKRVYNKSDFGSGDGMLTYVWGPALWHYLHTMSFNYPINPTMAEKKNYRYFILSLKNVLPCKYCRDNLKKNFKAHPLMMCHMKNRETFSRYIYKLHEIINKMLGKNSGLTYCDVRERYEHFRARCIKENKFKFKKTQKKEKGCTDPLYGKKAKCIMKIVPYDQKCKTLDIDKKCIRKR
tara:strand:+ start:17329 stop:17913 length:585 start_codon:yes stop_codon:yes gene_type:complete